MASGEIAETASGIQPEQCREQLQRILSSRCFAKSVRLCSMLEFICSRTLDDQPSDLTEQQIGISIFGRKPGYNSGEDTIVRSTARHLRQRLELYYSEEGRQDPVWITIPKGGYLAQFNPPDSAPSDSTTEAAEEGPEPRRSLLGIPKPSTGQPGAQRRWPIAAKIAVSLLALCAALELVAFYVIRQRTDAPKPTGPQALWGAIFTPGRKTLIVPGDAGLDAYVAWEQRGVSLDEYTNQTYQRDVTVSRPPSGHDVPISFRSVTPMADLRLVAELMRAVIHSDIQHAEDWTEIRYARDVVVADTQADNLILLGPDTFNPWVTLYQPMLDFYVHWDHKTDVYNVINRAPKSGEASHYEYHRGVPNSQAITLIALVDNSQGKGRVLIIEGTSMGATYAAISFLNDDHLWGPVLAAATGKNGQLRNFEVLLASDFVRGGVTNTRVAAFHQH